MNKDFHERIISKEQFEAVQLEMEFRSNVEIGEDGKARRKSKKYSLKILNDRRKYMRDKYSKSNINNVSGKYF